MQMKKLKILRIVGKGVILMIFLIPIVSRANLDTNQMATYQTANKIFHTKRTPSNVQQVINSLAEVYNSNSDDAQLNLLYAYALYYQASYIYWSEDEKKLIMFASKRIANYKLAQDVISNALDNVSSSDSEAKAGILLTKGLIEGQLAGLTNSALLTYKAKRSLEAALATNPSINNGAIYIALGRLYSKVPNILFGNKEKSLLYLRIAQTDFKNPNITAFLFEAETLMEGKKIKELSASQKLEVKKVLEKGLSFSKRYKTIIPEDKDALAIIKEYLQQL